MKIENMRTAISQLERLPDEQFYMGEWMIHPEEHHAYPNSENWCGTVGCIAGWVSMLNGNADESQGRHRDFAQEWLSLYNSEADSLFLGRWQHKELEYVTKREAINRMKHLVADAGGYWVGNNADGFSFADPDDHPNSVVYDTWEEARLAAYADMELSEQDGAAELHALDDFSYRPALTE